MMIQVTDHERGSRERLFRKKRPGDRGYCIPQLRVLTYGKMFGAGEALNHLSNIRMGIDEGILKTGQPAKDIYALMMNILPGTLMCREGKESWQCRPAFVQSFIHSSEPAKAL